MEMFLKGLRVAARWTFSSLSVLSSEAAAAVGFWLERASSMGWRGVGRGLCRCRGLTQLWWDTMVTA